MSKANEIPTVDAYFKAAHDLARLMRLAFDNPKSVPRAKLLKALKRFEAVELAAG
jgi:hypothetical protein